MKIVTLAIAVSLLMTACSSNSDTQTTREILADTSTTSAYDNSINTDTGSLVPPTATAMLAAEASPVAHAKTLTTKKATPAKTVVTSTTAPAATTPQAPAEMATETTAATEATPAEAVEPEKKQGWSNAAKGAVIGAGAGAIGGAVISKKKGKGAIIGGVLGAGAGYIIGKGKDKRQDSTAN